MPDLKHLAIWAEMDMEIVERGRDEAERERRLHNFVESIFFEEGDALILAEEEERELATHVDYNLWVPLYEMNKRYFYPRKRHLKQGVAALPGLPEWGHSIFKWLLHGTGHSKILSHTMARS
jgi:hypothetical protein